MANPTLNDSVFKRVRTEEGGAGWAAPDASTQYFPPINDGPISPYRTEGMTIGGAATATGVLFVLLLVGGAFGWSATKVSADTVEIPAWIIAPALAAFVLAIVSFFKPKIARFTSPFYAVLEGLFLGAISRAYEAQWDGLVLQAVLATAGVFAAMLFLYSTKVIKVTDRFRRVIIGATMGVAVLYLVALVARLFGGDLAFINSPSAFGIIFSVVVAGVAAFNLALDFDMIERQANAGAPKYMEWYCALGLMVTIVWLYLELLRLLSKLRER